MAMEQVHDGGGGPRGERGRTCLASEVHRALFAQSGEYRARRREIDAFNSLYGASNAGAGLRTGITVIPVVVHVVWNTAAQNISDAQIQSQIDVLNADYRRLNADAATVPAVFQPVAADSRIQFQLAVRDPNCQPHSGIVRRQTTVNGFTVDSNNPTTVAGNPVKFDASGGSDAWPAADYLNIWVCKFANSTLLGYSSFPGFPANVDGVAITFNAFGTIGTLLAGFNLGRTASHEIGHYLNLFHIWGNNRLPVCTDSDDVADTPNQLGPNTGCPAFPHVTCGNGPNGDMFMDYMDYVNDSCMTMFTAGQAARMAATLAGARASLIASEALVPAGLPPDLWSQDVTGDVGAEPDAAPGVMWESDDIWVRTANDGIANQEHQNPEYRVAGSSPNYVYVRVRNRGCGPVAGGTLKLYWAKASTALGWPAPWDGSVAVPALMGQAIGSQPTGGLPAGGSTILTFPWSPPNPADYSSFGADQTHFCLLARIETSATAPFGMTVAETSDLNANVRNNNNIVWKNVTVVDELPGGGRFGAVSIQALEEGLYTSLRIRATGGRQRRSILQWGRIEIDLGERLFTAWKEGGAVGEGIEPAGQSRLQILKPAASIGMLKIPAGEPATITLHATRHAKGVDHSDIFFVDVLQYAGDGKSEREVGGQRFVIKTVYRERKRRILDHLPVIHYLDAGIR